MAQNEYADGQGIFVPVPPGVVSGNPVLVGAQLTGLCRTNPNGVQVGAAPSKPTVPTLTRHTGTGAMIAGVFDVVVVDINTGGHSTPSDHAQVTLSLDTDRIDVSAAALPANVLARDFYVSQAHDDTTVLLYSRQRTGAAFSITAVGSGAAPPTGSTASALQSAAVAPGPEIVTVSVQAVADGGNSAVAVGDALYLDMLNTPRLTKKATNGILFGKALQPLTSGTTGSIQVLRVQV